MSHVEKRLPTLTGIQLLGAELKGLLVRVGADLSRAGGGWNGPMRSSTRDFVYVPIPESRRMHPGLETPYSLVLPSLEAFGVELHGLLCDKMMHLDPDFEHCTYGDQGQRGRQLFSHLERGDFIAFYASLRDLDAGGRLVYALIGMLTVERIMPAEHVPREQWHMNAHTRRTRSSQAPEVVVLGEMESSGRFAKCIPIGAYRDRAYRVDTTILNEWGGLSVRNGYLQRSARLPRFLDPARFMRWVQSRCVSLELRNN